MDAWVRAVRAAGHGDGRLGFEVECDLQGRPILLPEHAALAHRRIGAIHNLAATLELPRVAVPRDANGATPRTLPSDAPSGGSSQTLTDGAQAGTHSGPQRASPDVAQRAAEEYLRLLERFVTCGITTLAHPFRVFRRRGLDVPEWLFVPVAGILARHGVAAEINFHSGNVPSVALKV